MNPPDLRQLLAETSEQFPGFLPYAIEPEENFPVIRHRGHKGLGDSVGFQKTPGLFRSGSWKSPA